MLVTSNKNYETTFFICKIIDYSFQYCQLNVRHVGYVTFQEISSNIQCSSLKNVKSYFYLVGLSFI